MALLFMPQVHKGTFPSTIVEVLIRRYPGLLNQAQLVLILGI
jgi:hypothetical protein